MRTRQTPRKVTKLPGRYFTGKGSPASVTICDLSTGGCRFEMSLAARVIIGMRLQLFVAGTGPHHGTVKWIEKREAGVTFDKPLSDDQLEAFQSSHVPVYSQSAQADFDPMPDTPPQRFC